MRQAKVGAMESFVCRDLSQLSACTEGRSSRNRQEGYKPQCRRQTEPQPCPEGRSITGPSLSRTLQEAWPKSMPASKGFLGVSEPLLPGLGRPVHRHYEMQHDFCCPDAPSVFISAFTTALKLRWSLVLHAQIVFYSILLVPSFSS